MPGAMTFEQWSQERAERERQQAAEKNEWDGEKRDGPGVKEFVAVRANGNEVESPSPPLKGASLVELSTREINASDTLLGQRWLCRGGGAIIVGPSGQGKSSMAVQAAALWSCGRPAFAIKPAHALRVLIVQAEDDEGDCIEMARMLKDLGLTDAEFQQVAANTHIEFVNDKTSLEFTKRLDQLLELRPSDLVIINPLSAYLGGDTKDEERVNQFLRTWLNPILSKHGAAAIFIHHTPKTINRDTSEWRASDWMYAGSGVAGITNWARAYLVIEPTDTHGVFRLIAAKRGKRLGWDGHETYWAHSSEEGKILWNQANKDQIATAQKAAKKEPGDLLELIPQLDPISQERLFEDAKGRGIGRDRARAFVNILIDEKKIFVRKLPRPPKKAGVGYAQRPNPESE
jgi:hypothetical protein